MKCDWVLLNNDGSKVGVTLDESCVPSPGDGKWHANKGYTVRYLITDRSLTENPCIIATENVHA